MLKLPQVWHAIGRRCMDLDMTRLPLLLRAAGGRGFPREDDSLHGQVEAALREWQAAQNHFDAVSGVTEPDLVDHAIYNLEAAQRKYMYLLRQVQRARGDLGATHGEE